MLYGTGKAYVRQDGQIMGAGQAEAVPQPWYVIPEIANTPVCVFQAKGAVSYAESLLSLVSSHYAYVVSGTTTPSWSVERGWYYPGSASKLTSTCNANDLSGCNSFLLIGRVKHLLTPGSTNSSGISIGTPPIGGYEGAGYRTGYPSTTAIRSECGIKNAYWSGNYQPTWKDYDHVVALFTTEVSEWNQHGSYRGVGLMGSGYWVFYSETNPFPPVVYPTSGNLNPYGFPDRPSKGDVSCMALYKNLAWHVSDGNDKWDYDFNNPIIEALAARMMAL